MKIENFHMLSKSVKIYNFDVEGNRSLQNLRFCAPKNLQFFLRDFLNRKTESFTGIKNLRFLIASILTPAKSSKIEDFCEIENVYKIFDFVAAKNEVFCMLRVCQL